MASTLGKKGIMLSLTCDHCCGNLAVDVSKAGSKVFCAHCNELTEVPSVAAPVDLIAAIKTDRIGLGESVIGPTKGRAGSPIGFWWMFCSIGHGIGTGVGAALIAEALFPSVNPLLAFTGAAMLSVWP